MKIKPAIHSFSTRVSLYVLLIASSVFGLAFLTFYHSARSQVQTEAEKYAMSSLETTILRIDEILHSVEIAVSNNAWQINRYLDHPDSMFIVASRLLESNPLISGSAIAFEPEFYPEKGRFFSPYAYRDGNEIRCKQLGTNNYEYHYMDWYQIPKLLNTSYWSEPYFDSGGGEIIMTTYSLPLHNSEGHVFAIFTADFSLELLTQKVNAMQLYPNSYNFMIGHSGTYLAHPYPERILNETFFTATLDMADTTVADMGRRMLKGDRGFTTIQNDSLSTSYVFYAPITRAGWSVGVACTYEDIFAGVEHIRFIVMIIATIGLLLLLIFCIYTIRQQTLPLIRLAHSTRNIARGDLSTPLPQLRKRHDEVGTLYDSFGQMQSSLANYIQELATTTANKERIESELRIASKIQMEMIPKIFPPFPTRNDIDLYATLVSAREVGGDLYDFFVDNDRLYFAVGDVSGKGVPASLLMAVTRSLFRTLASHLQSTVELMNALNHSISESNESNMFVTMFLGILDLKSGALHYCNAGHNPPVMFSPTQEPAFLSVVPNIPLGVWDGFEFREQELALPAGSLLFLYTDGVTEAENTSKELFSDERLLATLNILRTRKPEDIIRQIMEEINSHSTGAEQNDDITMLCLQYTPSSHEKN